MQVVAAEFADHSEVRELLAALRLQWEEEIKDQMAQAVAQVKADLEDRYRKQMGEVKQVGGAGCDGRCEY